MSLPETVNPLLTDAQRTMVRALSETFHTLPPTGEIAPSWENAIKQYIEVPNELKDWYLSLEMLEIIDPFYQHLDSGPSDTEVVVHQFISELFVHTSEEARGYLLQQVEQRVQCDGLYNVPLIIQEHMLENYTEIESNRSFNLIRTLQKHMKSTAMVQRVR